MKMPGWIKIRGSMRAGLFRALAGTSAGIERRRGSVMIMILGALAMIAVIVVAYHAIGRGDSGRSAAAVGARQVDDQVARVGDYLSEILTRDVLATYSEGLDPATNLPIVMRETWDYPATDFRARSVSTSGNFIPFQEFDPAGSFDTRSPTGAIDLRIPSDPFLASTEPVWMDPSGTPTQIDVVNNSIDWLQITNAAPDGRFVNLFNLRNNFESASGFAAGEISSNLTLYDDTGDPYLAGGSQTLPWGAAADPNTPAHWTMYQRRALRPMNDPGRSWAAPEFRPYQWADADGDGLADSRWFELVDASDPRNVRSILPEDGRHRWFAAARIVDLSSLVNVNTATDFARPPFDAGDETLTPPGLYPSEVELRRLLTMSDTYEIFGFGYDQLAQPTKNTAENYSGYDAQASRDAGNAGYNALRLSIENGGVPAPGAGSTGFWKFSSEERAEYYRDFGAHGMDSSRSLASSPFGPADEVELRARRTINDDASIGRVESAVDGRDPSDVRYGPMRSPRSLAIEMGRDDDDGPQGLGDGFADSEALLRQAIDARARLTTLSGARPLTPSRIDYPSAADLRSYVNLLDASRELRTGVATLIERAADDDSNGAGLPDADGLFELYVGALAPHLDEKDAWIDERLFTLAYGYERFPDYGQDPQVPVKGPELALRMAAALTANQIDHFDFDADKATIDGPLTKPEKQDAERHEPVAMTLLLDPNYRATVASDALRFPWWGMSGRGLDAGDARLDATRSAALPRAINVFGVEAQPFLTEVVAFTMYTDAPSSTGKKDEFTGDPFAEQAFVTVDGTVNATNADFMLQMLAFQVTNPFDAEIDLTAHTGGSSAIVPLYYVEFAGKYYRLQAQDLAGGSRSPATLKPFESRVFYALSDDPSDIIDRWNAVRTPGDPLYAIADLEDWIERQISVELSTSDPPVTLDPVWVRQFDPLTGADLAKDPGGGEPADGVYTMLSDNSARNRVVRLWRRMLPTGETETSNKIENDLLADRLRDPTAIAQKPVLERRMPNGDTDIKGLPAVAEGSFPNSGISVVIHSSIRRPNESSGGGSGVEDESFQPYCIESRFGTSKNSTKLFPAPPTNPGSLKTDDFFDDENGYQEVGRMIADLTPLVATVRQHPEDKTGQAIGQNRSLKTFAQAQVELTPDDSEYLFVGKDGLFNSDDDRSVFRLQHLLAPLAVGPVQDPLATVFFAGEEAVDAPWITLSEMMSIAMDYDTPAVDDPTWGMYYNLGHETPTGSPPSSARVDRGRLVLDAYEPFMERGALGSGFDPAADVRRGLGIPLALGLLERARLIDDGFGSHSAPTYGTININTAPLSVLRAIPMLSPMGDPFTPLDPGASSNWWGQGVGGMHDTNADVAATLLAYRDKIPVLDRSGQAIDYLDSTATPSNPIDDDGRANRTGILAIREQRGFASIGEIMALIDRTATFPAGATIDQLGFDASAIDEPGVESTLLYDASGDPEPDDIADDHDEKLAIAGGALGSISVRSDLFAVYFVVHAYQRSDVEGLKPADPLVPSIARRYVMIVDRSNVIRRGDRARVLMLRELPL